MSLYDLLHKDHEKVAELFGLLEKSGESEIMRREQLLSSLVRELDLHSQAEEKYFYSRLKGEGETREMILESLDEHKEFMKALGELEAMDKGTVEFSTKLRHCRGLVESHVSEEENELFPRARRILGEDQSNDILQDITTYKEEHAVEVH